MEMFLGKLRQKHEKPGKLRIIIKKEKENELENKSNNITFRSCDVSKMKICQSITRHNDTKTHKKPPEKIDFSFSVSPLETQNTKKLASDKSQFFLQKC